MLCSYTRYDLPRPARDKDMYEFSNRILDSTRTGSQGPYKGSHCAQPRAEPSAAPRRCIRGGRARGRSARLGSARRDSARLGSTRPAEGERTILDTELITTEVHS
ncbi:unnamed protein product, partial [Brenthis ino]